MDGFRFDQLTRHMAGSRRQVLTAALGGALGVLGLTNPNLATAAKSGKCKQQPGECEKCARGKCKTKNGKKHCTVGKIRPKADSTACTGGSCQSGVCVATSTPCPLCGTCGAGGTCRCVPSRDIPTVIRCVGTSLSECPHGGCTGDAQCAAAVGAQYVCANFGSGACNPRPPGATSCCLPCAT